MHVKKTTHAIDYIFACVGIKQITEEETPVSASACVAG